MERSLDINLLRSSLGAHGRLPTPEELRDKLAEAEIALFLHHTTRDEELTATGWYLHAVGTTSSAMNLYGLDRQV